MVLGNGKEADVIAFDKLPDEISLVDTTPDELQKIFRQLDVLDITATNKTVLRKSQRNLDQKVAWKVFKRDGYKCIYCAEDNAPLTFDHLVLWEEGGDTVEDNGLSACKKCNHTRGSQSIPDFVNSTYFKEVFKKISSHEVDFQNHQNYILMKYEKALKLPLRPTKRSR